MPTTYVWRIAHPEKSPKLEKIILAQTARTLDEVSARLPGGVYTTFRTFDRFKALPLEPQFRRLEESASLTGKAVCLNREAMRAALRAAIRMCPEAETRVRLTLDLEKSPGVVYIAMEPLATPAPEEYTRGVNVVTQAWDRNNPKVKSTRFIAAAGEMRARMPEEAHEVLLVGPDGRIREGSSSNFFAVRGGELWTEGEHVLMGISRSLLLETAEAAGIAVHLAPVHTAEIDSLEEAFLTSASRSVLPVRKIDEQVIGKGLPGPVTLRLSDLYLQRMRSLVEEI